MPGGGGGGAAPGFDGLRPAPLGLLPPIAELLAALPAPVMPLVSLGLPAPAVLPMAALPGAPPVLLASKTPALLLALAAPAPPALPAALPAAVLSVDTSPPAEAPPTVFSSTGPAPALASALAVSGGALLAGSGAARPPPMAYQIPPATITTAATPIAIVLLLLFCPSSRGTLVLPQIIPMLRKLQAACRRKANRSNGVCGGRRRKRDERGRGWRVPTLRGASNSGHAANLRNRASLYSSG